MRMHCVHPHRHDLPVQMQKPMSIKNKKKKNLLTRGDLLTEVDGGRGLKMCCVWTPISVKKKKNILKKIWACRRGRVACGRRWW